MAEAPTQAQINNTSLADFLRQKGVKGIGSMNERDERRINQMLDDGKPTCAGIWHMLYNIRQLDKETLGREDFVIENSDLDRDYLLKLVRGYFAEKGYQEVPQKRDSIAADSMISFRKAGDSRGFIITGPSKFNVGYHLISVSKLPV